ncbi:MAG: hexose kinase [Clostridia bacterium]|nr:hexose kinase [Clostridia bacterium]
MIFTLTLNPAFDLHYEMEEFLPESENYVKRALKSAGGKGINVSKALSVLGCENRAFAVLGSENSAEFLKELPELDLSVIETEGRIRENITIHPECGRETRISLDNFFLSSEILRDIEKKLIPLLSEESIVVFAGKCPKGVKKAEIVDFLLKIRLAGARLVIDSKSFDLTDLSLLKPFLIKPNEEEIKALLNAPGEKLPDAAKRLNDVGIENVMISLGSEGIFYSGCGESFTVKAPEIMPVSTIGAGDSSIAGFIAGICRGLSKKETVCLAVASGSAACLSEGTLPPKKDDIERLYKAAGEGLNYIKEKNKKEV